jgi:hypothetical protein
MVVVDDEAFRQAEKLDVFKTHTQTPPKAIWIVEWRSAIVVLLWTSSQRQIAGLIAYKEPWR